MIPGRETHLTILQVTELFDDEGGKVLLCSLIGLT